MTYIGLSPPNTFTKSTSQTFTGNGSTTAFTLQTRVASPEDLEVFVSNVQQQPTESYTIGSDGVTMTFSEAPPSGTFYVIYRTIAQQAGTDTGASRLIGDNTFTGNQSITGDLTLTSTDAGASAEPTLTLYRNSASPADSDNVGEIIAKGRNDNSQNVEYSKILTQIIDVTDGTEDGNLGFYVRSGGSQSARLILKGNSRSQFKNRDVELSNGVDLIFEGATANSNEIILTPTDPTAVRTITLPDATGTVALQNASIDMNGTELILDADADTSITADTDDRIDFKTGGSDIMHIANGAVSIGSTDSNPFSFTGTTNPVAINATGTNQGSQLSLASTGTGAVAINLGNDSIRRGGMFALDGSHLTFATNNSNSGNSLTERMRISSDGRVYVGGIADDTDDAVALRDDGIIVIRRSSGSGRTNLSFINGGSLVGTITTSTSSTSYNTSSDYRLKENVSYDWDATSRLKQLKPARFNFKVDKDTTVDGFLAHEVSTIVPEAISGIKDETQDLGTIKDKDGNVVEENVLETKTKKDEEQTWTKTKTENVYQNIDQSKLVPLLVKSMQEMEARIATLESK